MKKLAIVVALMCLLIGTMACAGSQGATGAKGVPGMPGLAGLDGADGLRGPQGSSGVAGADGSDGVDGSAGAVGATGAIGATGATGAAGTTGSQGIAGSAGSKGKTGPSGLAGVPGADGADGVDGRDAAASLPVAYPYFAEVSGPTSTPALTLVLECDEGYVLRDQAFWPTGIGSGPIIGYSKDAETGRLEVTLEYEGALATSDEWGIAGDGICLLPR